MRDSWTLRFTIFALIAMSVCSACVSQPGEYPVPVQNISPLVNTGLRQIAEPTGSTPVSLYDARQMLGEIEYPGEMGNNSRQNIYYVLGKRIDTRGNAESWVFGTRSPEGNKLQVYEQNRWTIIQWPATLPSEEIPFDSIVFPEDLIRKNGNLINGSAGPSTIREIELKNGIYSLTLTSESANTILVFNATTGVLIA